MGEMDLRLVIETIFPDKALLDRVMASIKGFQEGQVQKNQFLINQNRELIQQMVRSGTITGTQLSEMNRALAQTRLAGSAAFGPMAQGAQAAGTAIAGIGYQGKFAVRVLEAFVLYRGFVFLQQGAINTTRALIDLNHQLALVSTQLPNMGQGQMGFLAEGTFKVARETGIAFTEVARALYNVSSAGYSGSEAMRVLELSAKGAVAGGAEVDTVFNSALSSMNSFGIGADRLEEVLDKQFTAVRRGIFTYEQFSTQVGVLSEAFAQAGQSIETTYAAMATVSQVFTGPQFNRGATGLRNLAEALTQHRDDFEAYGVSVVDASGNLRDLERVLTDLQAKLKGMTTAERAEVISTILPDVREQAGVQALLSNMDDFRRNIVEQKLAIGDLDKAYEKVSKSIQVQTGVLINNVQSGFTPLAKSVGGVVIGLNRADEMLPGFTSGLIALTGTVTALALAMAFLSKETTGVVVSSSLATRQLEFTTVAMSRRTAFSAAMMNPLSAGPIGSRITPLMAGGAVLAGAVGGGIGNRFGSGQSGFEWSRFLGAAATGAGTGALGFAAGPQVGAVTTIIGGLSSAISYSLTNWKQEIEDSAKSFADIFAEEFKANSGDVAESFVDAIARVEKAKTGGFGVQELLGMRLPAGPIDPNQLVKVLGPNYQTYSKKQLEQIQVALSAGAAITATPETYDPEVLRLLGARTKGQSVPLTPGVLADIRRHRKGQAGKFDLAQIGFNVEDQFDVGGNIAQNLLAAVAAANASTSALAPYKQSPYYQAGIEAARASAIDQVFQETGLIPELKNFATVLAEAGLSGEKAKDALESLARGDYARFLELTTAPAGPIQAKAEEAKKAEDKWLKTRQGLSALSPTSLADSMDALEEAIRGGLIESSTYTADRIHAFGDRLDELNQAIFKIKVVEEFQRVGEILGYNKDFLMPTLKEMLGGLRIAGDSFKDFFKDPRKIADLLAKMEFGDINVDQSEETNFNFIIRISEGVSSNPAELGRIADGLMMELQNRLRRTMAR